MQRMLILRMDVDTTSVILKLVSDRIETCGSKSEIDSLENIQSYLTERIEEIK